MAHSIIRIAVGILVLATLLLTLIAVLAIWNVFDNDILWRAISTIGVIGFGSLIVIVAAKVLEKKNEITSSN